MDEKRLVSDNSIYSHKSSNNLIKMVVVADIAIGKPYSRIKTFIAFHLSFLIGYIPCALHVKFK